MVSKLIKYDFRSYFRLLFPVQLIILGFALINRMIQFFEPPLDSVGGASTVYNGFFISSLVLYIISIVVCIVMTVIVGIVRFYQGMYTNEGYLNHTLPVTPTQHIFAKLLTSFIFCLGSLLAIFLSFMVITIGEVNIEVFKAFFYLAGKFFARFGANGVFYVLEFIILSCAAAFFVFIKLYCCISVGQLVNRKKVLLAFGVFFGIYVVKQIIGTFFAIFVSLNLDLFDRLGEWIGQHPELFVHIFFIIMILYHALFGLIYFLITKHIMSKKLNLT